MERVEFWIYSRKIGARKSKSNYQASFGAKNLWAVGRNLVKLKDQ